GGAVNGPAIIINCTFYGNKAKRGTGGAFQGKGRILNSIFYKNTAVKKGNDITAEGNLKIDFSLFNYSSGGVDVGTNIVMGDPKFVDPDNGDLHLRSDSPCIKKGKRLSLSGLKDAKNINIKPGVAGKKINMGADEAVLTSALKDYQPIPERIENNKTGLMWVKYSDSAGCNDGETLDWDKAMAFCEGLTYAGYSDWRIPNKEELTLQNDRHGNYWMMAEGQSQMSGGMQFNNGFSSFAYKTDNNYVCCVRAGSVPVAQ
ncbi:MAG: DUF1566 domain-containing protein, partial [Elusimicrobia bacterium]|nr:DUF1566 domain-containing protein [Elusimicrobiota bacterium]